ncbi:MAG: hypothetical protein Q9225_003011 [Loekoesia sp. 1 TL-2023]
MATFHALFNTLEGDAGVRLQLIEEDQNHDGMDKGIRQVLSQLQDEDSTTARAEDYCRQLKVVKRKLVYFNPAGIDYLITVQESKLTGAAQPNVSKSRSPAIPNLPKFHKPKPKQSEESPAAKPKVQLPTVTIPATTSANQRRAQYHASAINPASDHHRHPQCTHVMFHESPFLRKPPSHYTIILSVDSCKKGYRNENRYWRLRIRIGEI